MTAFRVLEVSPGASGFVPRLRAPLIGRDALFYFRGELEWVAGDLAAAGRWFHECLETARAEANLGLAGWMANALGLVLIEQERVDEAEPFVAIAEEVTPEDDVSEGIRLRMGSRLGTATSPQPRRPRAKPSGSLSSTESPELQGCAERALADVALARGRPAGAVAMLRRAVASFEHKGIAHRAAAARAKRDQLA